MSVYFVQAGGYGGAVKIGYARDVAKRLRHLQGSNPDELFLIREVPGGFAVENWLREYFRHRRIRGEWHRFDPEMLTIEVDGITEEARREVVSRAYYKRTKRALVWEPAEGGFRGYSPRTQANYEKIWRQFLTWRGLGDALPVTDAEVIGFLAHRLDAGRWVWSAVSALSTMHLLKGGDRISVRPAVKSWLKQKRID